MLHDVTAETASGSHDGRPSAAKYYALRPAEPLPTTGVGLELACMERHVAIVGGGAAGFMGAITCAEAGSRARVTLIEATREPLAKVRISGGGRCNVTTGCTDPAELIQYYPRGGTELRGLLTRFGPKQTRTWFEARGGALKTERDGRIFPVSDQSDTIVQCLREGARRAGVHLVTGQRVRSIRRLNDGAFEIAHPTPHRYDRILLATGGAHAGHTMAALLGHAIVDPVPSLFTFKVQDPRLTDLAGISVDLVTLAMEIEGSRPRKTEGPLLMTHWGLSGPAVLQLSSHAARELAGSGYRARLRINWLPGFKTGQIADRLRARRDEAGTRKVAGDTCLPLPARLWSRLVHAAGIAEETTWANLTRGQSTALLQQFTASEFQIQGRGVFKDEFVTCGGVQLKEVSFRTMESRTCPGLYLAGEILDIDGLTGGYNFQSAWTTGWLAGRSMADSAQQLTS